MRAAVYDRYGSPDVLRIDEVPVPAPAPGQVLVKVAATSVNLSDWEGLTCGLSRTTPSGAAAECVGLCATCPRIREQVRGAGR